MGTFAGRISADEKARIVQAEKMAEKLAKERGVNEELYKKDSLEWILETEKIQEEVQSALEKEIQR